MSLSCKNAWVLHAHLDMRQVEEGGHTRCAPALLVHLQHLEPQALLQKSDIRMGKARVVELRRGGETGE
jgi:hypothetical protein